MPKPRSKADRKRDYGTGSYRLKGNRYYIRYYHPITGRRVEEATPETNEGGAKAALKRKLAELLIKNTNQHTIPKVVAGSITVMDIVDRYADRRRDKVRSKEKLAPDAPVDLGTDEYIIEESLRPYFEHIKWFDLDTHHTTAFRDYRRAQTCKNGSNAKAGRRGRKTHVTHGTIDRELRVLRAAVNSLIKTGDKLARVVAVNLHNAKDVRKGFVTPAEFLTRLYPALDKPERRHIKDLGVLLFCSGARTGEMLRLRWENVYMNEENPDNWTLLILKSKNGDQREIPIFAGLMRDTLVAMKEKREHSGLDNPYVFPSIRREFEPIAAFTRSWRSAAKEAKLIVEDGSLLRPHDLRRSAARNMRNAGLTAEAVMAFMGHKSHAMLLRYNIISAEEMKIGRERMNLMAAEWSKYKVA